MSLMKIYEFLVKKNDEFEQFMPQPIRSFLPKWTGENDDTLNFIKIKKILFFY